jgi:hypothetical protein
MIAARNIESIEIVFESRPDLGGRTVLCYNSEGISAADMTSAIAVIASKCFTDRVDPDFLNWFWADVFVKVEKAVKEVYIPPDEDENDDGVFN